MAPKTSRRLIIGVLAVAALFAFYFVMRTLFPPGLQPTESLRVPTTIYHFSAAAPGPWPVGWPGIGRYHAVDGLGDYGLLVVEPVVEKPGCPALQIQLVPLPAPDMASYAQTLHVITIFDKVAADRILRDGIPLDYVELMRPFIEEPSAGGRDLRVVEELVVGSQ